uniref:DUF4470 domain-containing protein n=1 Tax=Heterorhabditis bacteriophora TaxID=37862 RepID=A0A1I7X1K1_HETBA
MDKQTKEWTWKERCSDQGEQVLDVVTLSKDTEISGFDSSKFIFTDITFDATDQDRTVVIREVDGTLRTATPEEHDRMNRIYYQKPNRPVFPPPFNFSILNVTLFYDALDRDEHEFVLDWACWFYEPDDPSFIKVLTKINFYIYILQVIFIALSQLVFDRIVEVGKFDVLHSTRHFGALVFYLALNDNISPLLNYMGGKGRIRDCANLVRLYKILHPDWRVAIGSGDNNEKIVKDYISQLFPTEKCDSSDSKKATINATNVKGVNGPLGELSEKYVVNLEKPERNNENEYGKKRIRGRYSRRYQDKSDTIDEN